MHYASLISRIYSQKDAFIDTLNKHPYSTQTIVLMMFSAINYGCKSQKYQLFPALAL